MSSRGSGDTSLALRFIYFSVAYLVLLGASGWVVTRSVDSAFTERLLDHIETAARISAQGMPGDRAGLQGWVEAMSRASGYRYTVVDRDGAVVADSHDDPGQMANHADRPEISAALAGEIGRSSRLSESTGFEQNYVAIPAAEGMVVRLSDSASDLIADTSPFRRSIILIAVGAGLVGLAIIGWMARRMSAPIAIMTSQTLALADGERSQAIDRSAVREIDQLGTAITMLDAGSRSRLHDAEQATSTMQVVLGALSQGTILFDADDAVIYSNPSAHKLLGAVPDRLSGLVPFSFQGAVEECRESRSPALSDAEHGRPVRMLRGIATPLADDRRVLLVVVDVTERERAASVRRDFVANASHELKTPVSAIIAASEALQIAVQRGDDSALSFAAQIEDSAHQLSRLVSDLLDLSRLERDHPELDVLSLDHLVREELERARPIAEDRSISLHFELSPVQVAGSGRDLAIAVRNLLDNAMRHTPSGGSIGSELTTGNGDAVLRIIDNGEGIPTRDLERVFERFYRVDDARARATGGTGLGLAIVKHIVESHGGSVAVESELGAGSTFTVRLPVLEVEAPASN